VEAPREKDGSFGVSRATEGKVLGNKLERKSPNVLIVSCNSLYIVSSTWQALLGFAISPDIYCQYSTCSRSTESPRDQVPCGPFGFPGRIKEMLKIEESSRV
jgi:hypothetical protein